MYLMINNQKHSVSQRIVGENSIKYLSVSPEPVELIGTIEMYRNDGLLLSSDNIDKFEKTSYTGTLLVLSNEADSPKTPQITLEQRVTALENSIQEGLGL